MSTAVTSNLLGTLLAIFLGPPEALSCWITGVTDWSPVVQVARKNVLLVRLAARFTQGSLSLPPELRHAAEAEQQRIAAAVQCIRQIAALCEAEKIPYCFPKALQHYPDMGHDIDLFVADTSRRIDAGVQELFRAVPAVNSWTNIVAGKTAYRIADVGDLEIHHGRMGHVGEHVGLAQEAMARRQWEPLSDFSIPVPSREDQLVIQALQRIYGHFSIRVSDLLHTVMLVQLSQFDWERAVDVAQRHGLWSGLQCYCSYVARIYSDNFRQSLLPASVAHRLVSGRWGTVRVVRSAFRFPTLTIATYMYGRKFLSDLFQKEWYSCAKLALIPFLTCLAAARRVVRLHHA